MCLTSLNESIHTQSPFFNPASLKPAHSFRITLLACREEIVRSGCAASMYICKTMSLSALTFLITKFTTYFLTGLSASYRCSSNIQDSKSLFGILICSSARKGMLADGPLMQQAKTRLAEIRASEARGF